MKADALVFLLTYRLIFDLLASVTTFHIAYLLFEYKQAMAKNTGKSSLLHVFMIGL